MLARLAQRTPWRAHVLVCTGVLAAVVAPTLSTVIAWRNGNVSSGGLTDLLGGLFLVGMVLFALLLFYGVMMSRKLMFHARPFPDRESQEALLAGAKVLQNVSLPILFTSDRVKSPTVWCWGLHPAVLLPEKLTARMSAEERDAVFLHELAHITRRDHLAALFCSLSGLLLFWHPLYWLALWQSDLLADEACDLLVLSRGTVSPGDYSEILLKLSAGEKRRPVVQFLSRKEKIMKRVNTIYDFADNATFAPANPSRLWTGSVVSLALLLCVGLAFCQSITSEKAMMMGYVEDFFNNNYRDITMRKTLEWGEVQTDSEGNRTIRYKFEALIWDKDRMIMCSDFTFDKDGKYVNVVNVEGFPKSIENGTVVEKGVAIEALKQYTVNKKVSDFKENDMSSPEAAYATLNKISASKNKDEIVKWEKLSAIELKFTQRDFEFYLNMSDDWVEVLKTAEILKVCVYNDQAYVIAKLGGKDTQSPYDGRRLKKVGDQWLNLGNNRHDSEDDAIAKFAKTVEKEAKKTTEEPVTSLEKFLNIEGLKRYPVNKRIADFPADKIDLSSPEAAYATQKNLIVSSRKDKFQQLSNMTQGRPEIPERERRAIEDISEEWAKTYREQFTVFEVFVVGDKYAFVFGQRQFDNLYDGNFFVKEGNKWLNDGNDQDKNAENLAGRVQRGLSRYVNVTPNPGTARGAVPSPAPLVVSLLEGFPAMKDLKKDALPFPAELVEQIRLKRQSLKSAQYTVESISVSKFQNNVRTDKNTARFKFQGKDQWLVDITDVMSRSEAFLVGCDGDREWCYSKNNVMPEPYYHERDLKNIREKRLSFLDPFSCANASQEQVKEYFQKQRIVYLGESEFEGKAIHLFGHFKSDSRSESHLEIALDAETLLPFYTRVQMNVETFGPIDSCYHFQIEKRNETYPATDFQQAVDKESKPKIMDKPEEGYEYFFVAINDGAAGRMTVRGNGQQGSKGTSSSGLN